MKVIFDANIFVSFLLSIDSSITKLYVLWKQSKFEVLVSENIFDEIHEVLSRMEKKKIIDMNEKKSLQTDISTLTKCIQVISSVNTSDDVKDNRYLSCAEDRKAQYLITGDKKHLLPLKKHQKTNIISPKELVDIIDR